MSWPKALAVWFMIVIAESIHGTIRQLFTTPLIGDILARQIGVFTGSAIIFAIALASIRWIGARTLSHQLQVGSVWVALTVLFEFALGRALGYPIERILADYDVYGGGLMGLGLLFMLFVPALAAKIRRVL